MRAADREQLRLDARAQAFADALSAASFAERTGQTWRDALETSVSIARQAADEHRKQNERKP